MLPEPLHPAIVHFPLVLVVLVPLFALGALVAIRRGSDSVNAWGLVVGLAALLVVSSFAALRTGEAQEDRVEDVVSERVIHEHEEAGERFLWIAAGIFLLTAGGLAPGRVGGAARGAATVGMLAALAFGLQVGRSGGELVYTHGAARAYVTEGADAAGKSPRPTPEAEEEGGAEEETGER